MSKLNLPEHNGKIPEARLQMAKEIFSKTILENDLLFAAIKKELDRHSKFVTEHELPDFELEPWRPASEVAGRQIFGVRLTQSVNHGDEIPGLQIAFGLYGYVPVVDMDMKTGEAVFTKELKAESEPEQQSEAVYHFWETYMGFLREIGSADGHLDEGISLDPMTGTFGLTEEIENRMYQSDLEDEREESPPG